MCGRAVEKGFLCDKCDRPRNLKTSSGTVRNPALDSLASVPPTPPPAPAPPKPPAAPAHSPSGQTAHAAAPQPEPFPKAPVLPFPVESTSIAMTSVRDVLTAARVPSILVASDRSVKFVSDDAYGLLEIGGGATPSLGAIEAIIGVKLPNLTHPLATQIQLREKVLDFSLIPLSGGAAGAVLIFRVDQSDLSTSSFLSYIKETAFAPLQSLRDILIAARSRRHDPVIEDAAATIDQILSTLEMSPVLAETERNLKVGPRIDQIVRSVADRFARNAELKKVKLQVDLQDMSQRFHEHEELQAVLTILMENSLHYVPSGGQIVFGARELEHKGSQLLLFYVMDNGPIVPPEVRETIFSADFFWAASAPERTGKDLSRVRDFAQRRGGQAWVESKTGKACTFFLRIHQDT